MAVILVRHTLPKVAPGTCYGRTNLDVSAGFQHEAEQVASSLPEFSCIVSSPLRRCRKLADYLASTSGSPVNIDPRIIEMDFGCWEGQLWDALPRQERDEWDNNFMHARPHGGETVAMLRDRTKRALADWSTVRQSVLLVTHSGVIRAALAEGDTADDFGTDVGFGEFVAIPA